MTTLTINDLSISNELDKNAMTALRGGAHAIGSYRHVHNGRWFRTMYRAFYVNVVRRGRLVRAIQRQWSYRRVQQYDIGRLSF